MYSDIEAALWTNSNTQITAQPVTATASDQKGGDIMPNCENCQWRVLDEYGNDCCCYCPPDDYDYEEVKPEDEKNDK